MNMNKIDTLVYSKLNKTTAEIKNKRINIFINGKAVNPTNFTTIGFITSHLQIILYDIMHCTII